MSSAAPPSLTLRVASRCSKRPRKVDTPMCLTAKPAVEWTGSILQTPTGSLAGVSTALADMGCSFLELWNYSDRSPDSVILTQVDRSPDIRPSAARGAAHSLELPLLDPTRSERADAARNRTAILCAAE